jgi:uncharacterized delta-60 repeat protein
MSRGVHRVPLVGIAGHTRGAAHWGVALALLFLAASVLGADRARLDPSFSRDGKVITKTTSRSGVGWPAFAVIEDPRGRLIAAGGADDRFVVARYLRNGRPDTSFGGGDGKAYVGDWKPGVIAPEFAAATAVTRGSDGTILAVGFLLLTDESTGGTGLSCWAIARLRPNGSLDETFGSDAGRQLSCNVGTEPFAVEIQRDGKFLVGGVRQKLGTNVSGLQTGVIARYLANGRLDRTFGPRHTGMVRIHAPKGRHSAGVRDLDLLRSGNILASGYYDNRFMLARLLLNGTFDRGFGPPTADGRVVTDVDGACDRCTIGWGMARDLRGRVLITGSVRPRGSQGVERYIALARYRGDGRLDRTFGRNGIVRTTVGAFVSSSHVAIQRDGRIVVVGGSGSFRHALLTLVRYEPDGSLDRSFFDGGVFARRFGSHSGGRDVIIDHDGRIVASGLTLLGPPPATPSGFPPDWSFLVTRVLPGPDARR